MNKIDLTPLYRSSIGFDRFGTLLDSALRANQTTPESSLYDIEVIDNDQYAITLAVPGFDESELDIQIEKDVLTVCGRKSDVKEKDYLYHGINRDNFEQKFNLADYIKVKDAKLNNGLLTINLIKEVPEAMKPKKIKIQDSRSILEHKSVEDQAA